MSIKFVKGNIINANCEYICHQVNCQGKMRSGVALAISQRWPEVYNEYIKWHGASQPFPNQKMLGNILAVPAEENKTIVNMAAQDYYGYDGRRYTSYDAFWSCLGQIKELVPQGSRIAFPDHIGCCRGGANWIVIWTMIEEVLAEDYHVYIYEYQEEK